MRCYRIRKRKECLADHELKWMAKTGETDMFMSGLMDTLKGAKSALNNRNGYLASKKDTLEIVEYDMTEVGTLR